MSMQNMNAIEQLVLLNTHIQHIISATQSLFNGGIDKEGKPMQISKPYLLESIERAKKHLESLKKEISETPASPPEVLAPL